MNNYPRGSGNSYICHTAKSHAGGVGTTNIGGQENEISPLTT